MFAPRDKVNNPRDIVEPLIEWCKRVVCTRSVWLKPLHRLLRKDRYFWPSVSLLIV